MWPELLNARPFRVSGFVDKPCFMHTGRTPSYPQAAIDGRRERGRLATVSGRNGEDVLLVSEEFDSASNARRLVSLLEAPVLESN